MTSCTTDSLEKSLPFQSLVGNRPPWRWSQQLHEVFEVVDAPQPRVRIQSVLQSWNRIEKSNLCAVTARTNLVWKKIVGNSHFIAVRLSSKRQESSLLGFPLEPPNASCP